MTADVRTSARSGNRTYRRSESVVFFKTRDAFGELSNMASRYPLAVGGVTVPSSEALYQACRFPHLPQVQKLVITQKSPMTAKMVSKPHRSETRADWDDIRVAVMKWCLRVKLRQHWKEFGDALLRTGDRPIVEQSRKDPFWGAIPDASGQVLVGANVLGRLLMELRELLKRTPSELEVVKPVPVDAFCLLGRPIQPIGEPPFPRAPQLDLVSSSRSGESAQSNERLVAVAVPPKAQPTPSKSGQLTMFQLPAHKHTKTKTSKKADYHVVHSTRGGWDVVRDGGKRASAHFATKAEAIARGRRLASKYGVNLVQHTKEASSRANDAQQSWLHP